MRVLAFALMLFNARAEAPSPPEPWIDRCAIGFVDGCMEQVADAFAGTAPAFHRVGAAKLFANECADDDADSCAILGLLYVHGFGVEPDLRHAAMLFDHACIEQVAWACAESARLSTEAEGGVPRNDAKAATLKRKSSAVEQHPASECSTTAHARMSAIGPCATFQPPSPARTANQHRLSSSQS